MNHKQLVNWRDDLKLIVIETQTDVKWIKANLTRISERQDSLAGQVAWLKGLGSIATFILGSVLSLVSFVVFG